MHYAGPISWTHVCRTQTAEQQVRDEEEQKMKSAARMTKLSRAVEELSKRSDGGADGDYYFELQNQNGEPIRMPEKERKLLTQGIACTYPPLVLAPADDMLNVS